MASGKSLARTVFIDEGATNKRSDEGRFSERLWIFLGGGQTQTRVVFRRGGGFFSSHWSSSIQER